jgi:hypothetical protein
VNREAPAIVAESGGLTVSACEFLDEGDFRRHIQLGADVEAALIVANRFRSKVSIDNQSEGDVQIGLNAAARAPGILSAIDAGDADRVAAIWSRRLQQAPLETFPVNMRLASAQTLAGSRSHQPLRTKMLHSIASMDQPDESLVRFVQRARDELALDAAREHDRPTVIARRSGEASPVRFDIGDETQTQASLTWDENVLRFQVRVDEPAMQRLRAQESRHDGRLWTDDSIEIFLSPRRATSGYLQLIVNANGAHYDGIGTMRATNAQAWNASPTIRVDKADDHWTIDLSISWQELKTAAPAPGDVWGIDLRRWRYAGGKTQHVSWADAPLVGATHHPEAFGYVRFE